MSGITDFESAVKRLEIIADKLEEGNLTLDESIALYEEGMKLSKFCEKKLTDVEERIEYINSYEIPSEPEDEQIIVSGKADSSKVQKSKKKSVVTDEETVNESFLF